MNNKKRYTASVEAAVRVAYLPKVILNNRETIKYFQFIDNFLYSDNKNQFDFNDLIDNTVVLFSILSLPNKKIIFAELEKIVLGYEAEKEHAVEYDKGKFIDKTPKKIGSHTIQSEHKKVNKEQTSLKLRFIKKYKEWLEKNKIDLLKENSQNIQLEEGSRTKMLIEEQFKLLDVEVGWKYAFFKEEDYKTFVNILVTFFEGTDYDLKNYTIIKLKPSCKIKLAKTLYSIYRELSEVKLKSNTDFLNIIRLLSRFKDDNDLYKTLTRNKY